MTQTLKAGERYRTRDGHETSPLETASPRFNGYWRAFVGDMAVYWYQDGQHLANGEDHPLDLIAPVSEPAPERLALDVTKPVQTVNGKPVRIICTDKKDEHPVVGLMTYDNGTEKTHNWTLEGQWLCPGDGPSPLDLINVPEPPRVVWGLLAYSGAVAVLEGLFISKKAAEETYPNWRERNWSLHRIEHIPGHADGEKA